MHTPRLAVVTSHPIQYYAPWFRFLTLSHRVNLRVFYLWDHGVRGSHDPGFDQAIEWDVPLLDGYPYEFVPNVSQRPGTEAFLGLRNPTLTVRLQAFAPKAVLLIGYSNWSFLRLIFSHWPARPLFPLIFRGDSHRLVNRAAGLRERLKRRLITAVYRRFAAVLYVGTANRQYFRWHDVPDDRLYHSPHAIDEGRFSADPTLTRQEAATWRATLGVPADHALVMFAGKFEEKKRPQDLLEAIARLADRTVSLVFVGSGRLESDLRRRAKDVPNVYFAPFQNQSVMPRTYAAADLFVLPSYGPGETWGLAINEALCLGRPVITSDHVGCAADLVEPGRNGLIFPAGDVDQLVQVLREALSDRPRLARWGAHSREVIKRYTYEQASEGLFQALAAVTERHAGTDGQP